MTPVDDLLPTPSPDRDPVVTVERVARVAAIFATIIFFIGSAFGLTTWVQSERKTYAAVEIIDTPRFPAPKTQVLGEVYEAPEQPTTTEAPAETTTTETPAPAPATAPAAPVDVAAVAPAAPVVTQPPSPKVTRPPSTTTNIDVTGALVVESFYSPDAQRSMSTGCGQWLDAYRVAVGGTTASLSSRGSTTTEELSGAIVVTCSYTYSASVPQSSASTAALKDVNSDATLDSGSDLAVRHRFCPEC